MNTMCSIDAIVAKVSEKNAGFQSLMHEFVTSELFRTKSVRRSDCVVSETKG